MKMIGKPYSGKPNVRFDEGELEIELLATTPALYSTGRVKLTFGVAMMTEVKYEEITDRGLTITTKEGKRQTLEADTIVTALPLLPNTEFLKSVGGSVPECYAIGDCRDPNKIIDAIADGSRIARMI